MGKNAFISCNNCIGRKASYENEPENFYADRWVRNQYALPELLI